MLIVPTVMQLFKPPAGLVVVKVPRRRKKEAAQKHALWLAINFSKTLEKLYIPTAMQILEKLDIAKLTEVLV